MSDLASRVVLSPSGVTRAVDQLESDGLVERRVAEGDKRAAMATLTADGRATLRKAVNVHVRGLREQAGCRRARPRSGRHPRAD